MERIDKTAANHIQQMVRILNHPMMNFHDLDECTEGLIRHLQDIIHEKDLPRALDALHTYNKYEGTYHFINRLKTFNLFYIMKQLCSCQNSLDTLLYIYEDKNEVSTDIARSIYLHDVNWSLKKITTGKIKFIRNYFFQPGKYVYKDRNLFCLKKGSPIVIIYLMENRPSVSELMNCDGIVISAAYGSEEMEYAISEGITFINGAEKYFSDLLRLNGKVVTIIPQ